MTEEEQRIAIAEACGWEHWFDGVANRWKNKKSPYGYQIHPGLKEGGLPDYLNDLNAMHEAEKQLVTARQQNDFIANIAEICWADESGANNQVVFNQLNATAAQRAEAFLRTLGKWKP